MCADLIWRRCQTTATVGVAMHVAHPASSPGNAAAVAHRWGPPTAGGDYLLMCIIYICNSSLVIMKIM